MIPISQSNFHWFVFIWVLRQNLQPFFVASCPYLSVILTMCWYYEVKMTCWSLLGVKEFKVFESLVVIHCLLLSAGRMTQLYSHDRHVSLSPSLITNAALCKIYSNSFREQKKVEYLYYLLLLSPSHCCTVSRLVGTANLNSCLLVIA